MEKILEVKNLCKTYITNSRPNNVLKNVNFTVDEGEYIAIMGPSGSGKSTLLYAISGMDFITSGKVLVDGIDISKMTKKEISAMRLNKIGFVFQQMHMLRNLSIYDNIILPAYSTEKGKTSEGRKAINDDAKKLMQRLDISHVSENDISEVSGGELQRACVCRAVINQPKIVYADEPTGALNSTASSEVMNQIDRISETGTTVLVVTHDAKVASRSSRVLFMMDGSIKAELNLGKYALENDLVKREKTLKNWLIDMGW